MKTYINYINGLIFKLLPETRCFGFKRFLLKLAGIKVGNNVRVCSSISIVGNGEIIIGDNVWVGPQVFLSSNGGAKIIIGAHSGIAPQVYIATGTHEIDIDGISSLGKGYNLDIIIGEGAWVGPKSLILPGSIIGKKAIIAAGAVVKSIVADRTMVGGVPAKFIKNIADV